MHLILVYEICHYKVQPVSYTVEKILNLSRLVGTFGNVENIGCWNCLAINKMTAVGRTEAIIVQ